MSYNQWIRKELFSPVNIFIILLNTLFFISVLVVFFWFILSEQFEIIMLDKIDIITLLAKNDESVNNSVKDYIAKIDYDEAKNTSESTKKIRNKENNKVFIDNLVWWFVVLGILTIISFLYLIYNHHTKQSITTGEIILILLVVISFAAEIVFYFALVVPWKFIGDFQLLKNLMPNMNN